MEESHELLVSYGNEKIWDVLAENPRNRVVVFGEQPEMLRFPCSTQSYTDIEGSGGNFNLSSSPEALAEAKRLVDNCERVICTVDLPEGGDAGVAAGLLELRNYAKIQGKLE